MRFIIIKASAVIKNIPKGTSIEKFVSIPQKMDVVIISKLMYVIALYWKSDFFSFTKFVRKSNRKFNNISAPAMSENWVQKSKDWNVGIKSLPVKYKGKKIINAALKILISFLSHSFKINLIRLSMSFLVLITLRVQY